MTTVLLDTHVIQWWSAEPDRLSRAATRALEEADELAVATVELTPAIAATAASLPSSFPGDPADRLIYATPVEHGWRLVSKDRRIRTHRHPRPLALW